MPCSVCRGRESAGSPVGDTTSLLNPHRTQTSPQLLYLLQTHLSSCCASERRRWNNTPEETPMPLGELAAVCHQGHFEQGTMGNGCRLHLSASIEPIWPAQPLTGWQWDQKPLRFHLDFPESPAHMRGVSWANSQGSTRPCGEAAPNSSDICQRGEAKIEK